jgi:hypothetical protein
MAACVDMSGIRREHTNNTWPSITTELTMKKPTTDRQSTHKMSSTSTDGILEENLVHNQTGSSTLTARESDHCVATNDESAVDALFVLPKSVAKAVPRLYKTALAPLDLSFDHVREEPYRVTMNQASRQVIRQAAVKKSGKAQASICFVVKRPGMRDTNIVLFEVKLPRFYRFLPLVVCSRLCSMSRAGKISKSAPCRVPR